MKEQAKRKGKPAEQTQNLQIKLATHERGREDTYRRRPMLHHGGVLEFAPLLCYI